MDSLIFGELRIDPVFASPGAPIVLRWRGKATERRPTDQLMPYLEAALAVAGDQQAPLELRVDELLHVNSSTIGCIVDLIREARARGVRLVLGYNAGIGWQRLSFGALRIFVAPDGLFTLSAGSRSPDVATS